MNNTPRRKDLSGHTFGKLEVQRFSHVNGGGNAYWLCLCECGKEHVASGTKLMRGITRHCGCMQRQEAREDNTIHGQHQTPTYHSWEKMKSRCYNPNNPSYARYGGLGVTVCEEWRHSFEAFYRDMGERPEGLSLDRIDPYGNYEPWNCRWATWKEQANNQRRHKLPEEVT